MKNQSPTRELLNFVVNAGYEDLPQETIEVAKRCFLDWIGVTIGGMTERSVTILADLIEKLGGHKQASIIGYGIKTSIVNAALVNGTMAHSLDYDDAHMHTRSHPSSPLIAALLPIAEYNESSGSELITAFVIGCEVGSRIGLALGLAYYDHGWHSTPILGRFGVAAGVGKLMGLDSEMLNHAFGLAATQAGGIRKSFGTMAKPFHAGKAAMDGILSALLARDGFTACQDVLDEGSGFGRMLSPQFDPFQLTADLGKRFNVLDVSFKPYAACLAIHPVISGIVSIGKAHRLDPETIERIDLKVAPICVVLGGNADPRSALEGKFSAKYCSALAMSEGHVGESLFVDELVNAPHIRHLMECTNIREDGTFQESEALVEVVLKNGKRFTEHVKAPKGDPRNPLNFDEISEKVSELTEGLLSEEQTEKIISAIRNLEKAGDILGLLQICQVAETAKFADP